MANQPSENPKYKLHYFNAKALGESIRFLFAYGGIEYEDICVPLEEWSKIKPTMPMGQMPVLEIDGQRLYQSSSIARYIAKSVKLAGTNDWENLLIDIAVDTINDSRLNLGRLTWADFVFVGLIDFFNKTVKFDISEKYENIKRVIENVTTVPSITEWIEKRPQTEF